MTLADSLTRAINTIYSDRNTVPCVYTNRDGVTQTVRAIPEYDLTTYGDTLEVSGKTAIIGVRASEMAAPRNGETYTIDGTVYRIDSLVASDELEHRALVA